MKKNIGILGLGKSGVAAANLAIRLGYNVFASDVQEKKINDLDKNVIKEFGEHSNKILNSDIIIKSPGICLDIPILKKARELKIKIMSEFAFAFSKIQCQKIIAITGTNGKTTTVDLISKIIKTTHKNCLLLGNIGIPLAAKTLEVTKNTFIIVELSSYQLENTPNFRPNISVLLNITPDHIEHHKTFASYIKAKENIFINQTTQDFAIINYDDKICKNISTKTNAKLIFFSTKPLKNGVFYNNGNIIVNFNKKCNVVIKPKINILGRHNISNILAATAVSYIMDIEPTITEEIISKYKGMEHRLEFVRSLNGVNYYNDSKSTNVDSTKVAIESFNKNILLIMGGVDKGYPYTPLNDIVKQKVKSIFLIGEATNKIKTALNGTTLFIECDNMKNAVEQIFKVAMSGDIVLLSPGCSSFDQFDNFEERGNFFKKLVKNL
ncbi:MAG: UDP-N-acetylmuramoyl-L-alanine--D-glutamate ligase [Endomicrobium sp.]|jgi:UDP-N-acetylmuramoylalanine--D-glutamate ligase|nr:UDP-N-acetylmuramoyl-L-alanine--D-glutamate ligase [Endomicrobium sp.]